MPFENGTFTVCAFELRTALPENVIELFAAHCAGTLDSVTDEPQIGWVTGRHLLDTAIKPETVRMGSCYYLQLRKAERKVPASLLNAICRREELAYMETNKAEFVPSKIKKQIREDAREKHLAKMPPALSAIPVVIDPTANLLYLGAGSNAQIDLFVEHFYSTCKIEPLQVNPGYLLQKQFEIVETSLPAMNLTEAAADAEPAPGRDFLTWLWYFSETGGPLKLEDEYGAFELLIEGPLTLTYGDDARGSAEVALKKGDNPLRSAEAKAALLAGKKLRKAKLTITRDKEFWTCVFDADKFSFGSVKLPEGDEQSLEERLDERMQSLRVFKLAIEAYFRKFAEMLLAMDYPDQERKLRAWAADRDAL